MSTAVKAWEFFKRGKPVYVDGELVLEVRSASKSGPFVFRTVSGTKWKKPDEAT